MANAEETERLSAHLSQKQDRPLLKVTKLHAEEFFAWLNEPARVIPEMERLRAAEPFPQA